MLENLGEICYYAVFISNLRESSFLLLNFGNNKIVKSLCDLMFQEPKGLKITCLKWLCISLNSFKKLVL